jgi:acyl carrier protein
MSNPAPAPHSPRPAIEPTLRIILESAVGKRSMPKALDDSTPLLGAVPELDSMAVLSILTQIQEDLGCPIEDDEVEASIFETFGSLRRFVESKLA